MISNYQFFILTCVLGVARASDFSCFGEYCFHLPDGNGFKTLSNASAVCKNSGLTLLEISSSQVQNSVSQFISQLPTQSLNGKDVILNAGRVTKMYDFYWINGKAQSGATVGGGSSSDAAAYQNYGYLHRTDSAGAIYRDRPTTDRGYICEYNASSQDCSYTYNGRCYNSSDSSVGWFEARNRCLQSGGDLAMFDYITSDPELNDIVRSWTQLTGYYWIGIRSIWWKWKELDVDAKYTNFVSGRPNAYANQCLCLASASQWRQWIDCSCNSLYQFICYKIVPTTAASTTTSTPMSSFIGGLSSTTASTSSPTTASTSSSTTASTPSSTTASTSSSTTASTSSSTTASTSSSTTASTSSTTTANVHIGTGIGIGVFILVIVCIIIIIIVLIRRRKSNEEGEKKPANDDYEHPKCKNKAACEHLDYAKLDLKTEGQGFSRKDSDGYLDLVEVTVKTEKDGETGDYYDELTKPEEEPRYIIKG